MKRFWLILSAALGLAIALPAFADVYTVRLDASDVTITGSFRVIDGLDSIRNIRAILVKNRNADEVAINCSTSSGKTPSNTHNIYVDATETWAIDDASLGNACFIKSQSGDDIDTGIVVITVVGS
jgi:hypothetical protein